MMRYGRILLFCLALFWVAVPVAGAAAAGSDMVGFSDIQVPAGTVVKNVVVMGANAVIAGTVTDEVVVINGDVTLLPTAVVHDRVVVIGGNIRAAEGASYGKGLVRIGPEFVGAGGLAVAGVAMLLWWLLKILVLAVLVVVPVLVAWLWRAGTEDMSRLIEHGLARCLTAGVLGGLIVMAVTLLLFLSIIGIPLAIVVSLIAFLASAAGMGGVSLAVGRRLPLPPPTKNPVAYTTLYGAILLALTASVPLAGFLVIAAALTVALGAFILKIFTKPAGGHS